MKRPFKVPFSPVFPLIGIAFCVYLMIQLPGVTWIRFLIWLIIGLIIYFASCAPALPGQARSCVGRIGVVVNALPPLIAAYKGEAGPDVLMFGKVWSQASGRPLRVVTIYPGPAPISMGRVDAEWVAYNHEEANALLDEARGLLKECDAEFVAVPSDSAARGYTTYRSKPGPTRS